MRVRELEHKAKRVCWNWTQYGLSDSLRLGGLLLALSPKPRCLQHNDRHAENREEDDPADDSRLQNLVKYPMRND